MADKIEKEGTDLWFSHSASELLNGYKLPEEWEGRALRKGTDTLDVWIDSGRSHRSVLKVQNGLKWPADLYLEGSDQHRGWFQSSLLDIYDLLSGGSLQKNFNSWFRGGWRWKENFQK